MRVDDFRAQLTKQLITTAERYAASRARGVERAGGKVDDLYARELVQDVLTDTLAGELAWNPARCTLETHVLDSIRFRTRHHRERARRFQHISLESCDENTRASIEDALAASSAPASEDARQHVRCLESIRRAAEGDHDIMAILDAFSTAECKGEVLRIAAMTDRQYSNAKKRLARIVRKQRQGRRRESSS